MYMCKRWQSTNTVVQYVVVRSVYCIVHRCTYIGMCIGMCGTHTQKGRGANTWSKIRVDVCTHATGTVV